MEIIVQVPIPSTELYPVLIHLEPGEAQLLCKFFGKTNKTIEAELMGESVTSEKIRKLDELLFRLYLGLGREGY